MNITLKTWTKPTCIALNTKKITGGTGFDFPWESRKIIYNITDTVNLNQGTCGFTTTTEYPDDEGTTTTLLTVTTTIVSAFACS